MSEDAVQLPLGIGLRSGPSLANFVSGPNGEALGMIKAMATGCGEQLVYLWGGRGTGKTHLLEAVCREVSGYDGKAAYLPLGAVSELATDLLAGLEQLPLVCIDDIDAVAGEADWEEAVFHLYNEAEQNGTRLIVAGKQAPTAVGFKLPDLASRLAMGIVFHLRPLNDEARLLALQRRAHDRGFRVPDDVAAFLLRRYPRDMHSLFALLERLDRLTLAAKRRVTIPFVKGVLAD